MTTTDERRKEDLDPRLREHLETQVRNLNAEKHEWRIQLEEAKKNERAANEEAARGRMALMQLERVSAKEKAAEEKAAAAQRRLEAAELELVRARGESTELRERLSKAEREADRLHALEDRIAKAKHAGDLFA